MPFQIISGNIVDMKADAIVNAANSQLQMGGGVCGAIFTAAGAEKMQAACDAIGGCQSGNAVMTPGFKLPASYVIHTVGPVWHGGSHGEEAILHSCYMNSMCLAVSHQLESIAFPLISSGIYGYPKDQALKVAVGAISEFLQEHDLTVILVIRDKPSLMIDRELFAEVSAFLDQGFADYSQMNGLAGSEMKVPRAFEERFHDLPVIKEKMIPEPSFSNEIQRILSNQEDTFSEKLVKIIDFKGLSDAETCKKANIDRRLFSKICCDKTDQLKKETAIALAIALELSLDETSDFLGAAGYSLSKSNQFDLIVNYFLRKEEYDIYTINETLFAFGQKLLGGSMSPVR